MNIKSIILKKIADKGEIRVADIVKTTGFSRAYLNRFFKELREENKIVLLGRANQARYVLAKAKTVKEAKKQVLSFHRVLENKNIAEDAILDEIQKNTGVFINLPKNVAQILNYAFTEMLNNAIEHSRSRKIEVFIKKDKGIVRFDVIDRGVGIFNNIMKKRRLNDELEAIQDLIKGKQTTVPMEHSGEGIFFTSKAGDILTIQSSNKKLVFNNILEDVFIKDIRNFKGTKIAFAIDSNSKKALDKIFRQYSNDLFEFSKTRVTVKLYKLDTGYISRSQGRRIVSGLEKFKTVILDFANVGTVGQSFADEVFRVWKSRHPDIDIQYENANENVDFMIKRTLSV